MNNRKKYKTNHKALEKMANAIANLCAFPIIEDMKRQDNCRGFPTKPKNVK